MSLTPKITKHIAKLARIDLSPDEIEPTCHTLNDILGWIDQLSEVCTDNIPPILDTETLRMREDIVTEENQRGNLFESAPQTSGPFYTVPRVVE